jgi:hypothetical protein
MGVPRQKECVAPLTEEDRKIAAWDNACRTSDEHRRRDHRGLTIDWDQFGKHSRYGWLIEYIQPLEQGGDEPSNLRARHWCDSLECFETALLMDP